MKDKFRALPVEGHVLQVLQSEGHRFRVILIVIGDVVLARERAVGVKVVLPLGYGNGDVCGVRPGLQLFDQLNGSRRCVFRVLGFTPSEKCDGLKVQLTRSREAIRRKEIFLRIFVELILYVFVGVLILV